MILVDPKLGVNSIADLVARAKANPNELNYASPGIGTTPHLSGELFKIVAGVNHRFPAPVRRSRPSLQVPRKSPSPRCRRHVPTSNPAR